MKEQEGGRIIIKIKEKILPEDHSPNWHTGGSQRTSFLL